MGSSVAHRSSTAVRASSAVVIVGAVVLLFLGAAGQCGSRPLAAGACRACDRPSATVAPRSAPPVNVILFGWDGAQRAHVKECLSRGELPTLKAIAAKGRLVAVDVVRTTDTKAGWAQILTGYQPETSGVASNSRYQPIPDGYTVFERLERAFGSSYVTVAVVAKKDHVGCAPGLPFANAVGDMEHFDNGLVSSQAVAERAMQYLERYRDRRFFFFVHFGQPDASGHGFGEDSREYNDGLVGDDYWTGQVLAKLKALGLAGRTAVYVTADHGFDEGLKSHGDAPYVFLATTDKGVTRRGLREDIAPTIYDRLGLGDEAFSPALDGHSLRSAYEPPQW